MGQYLGTVAKYNYPVDPERLRSVLRPQYTSLLKGLNYHGAPQVQDEVTEALLSAMLKKAEETKIPLDIPLSAIGFRLGYAEAALAFPEHPVEVQCYIGCLTWIVVQIDDIAGSMVEDINLFQKRFQDGEAQPHYLLHGLAYILRETYDHWSPILANLLVNSVLKFITSDALDLREDFKSMKTIKEGWRFPWFFRDMSGLPEAYAIFTFPQKGFPDYGAFLQALPDIGYFLCWLNDLMSFYKEELVGETTNYIHQRARCEGKTAIQVWIDVKNETVECVRRIDTVLAGKEPYYSAWRRHLQGYTAMHTTNPRYRWAEFDMGEENPIPERFGKPENYGKQVSNSEPEAQDKPQ